MSGMDPAAAGVNAGTFDRAWLAGLEADGANSTTATHNELVEEHGEENVNNAIANLSDRETVQAMIEQIRNSDHLSEPAKEAAIASLEADLAASERPTTDAATDAVAELYLANIRALNEELAEEGAASADQAKQGERGAGGSGSKGNWLVLMAQAMARIAGDHLAKSLEYAEQIGTMPDDLSEIDGFEPREGESDEAAQARATTLLQAKMQAETQLFKMVFEAASTLVKTAGESFSTMARKQ